MAEETYTALDVLMRIVSKNWLILLAPIPGVALKTYLEYRIHKTVKWREAIVSGLIAVAIGWGVGYLAFLVLYKPSMSADDLFRVINYVVLAAVMAGLLGEKMALYFYENLFAIMDTVVAKFTGKTPRRTIRPSNRRRK